MTQTASRLEEQRAFLLKIKNDLIVQSDKPNFDDCTVNERKAVNLIVHNAETPGISPRAIANLFKKYDKVLQRFLAEPEPKGDATEKPTIPDLPENARRPTGLLGKVSPWLSMYIDYSREVSPEGYKDFHVACGLWVLSTVAARRIQVPLSDPVMTPLTLIMVGRTSLFAKSVTAKAGIRLLKSADLGFLLGADETTPQRLLYRMAGHVPANYGDMAFERKELTKRKLAFSGQIGWYYDEFNQLMNAMTRPGPMADFAGLIRKLDNGQDEYSYETKSGDDYITNPYLALLGSTTPANLAKHANKNSEFWNDGFWARMLFSCPPPNDFITQTMEEGIVYPPQELSARLAGWHKRLGVPTCEIEEKLDEKGKPTGSYEADTEPLPLKTLSLQRGVREAFDTYRVALRSLLAKEGACQDLDGSYSRLATMALRIAALLASLENGGCITLDIWSLAQEIAEMFRENLHRLYEQVSVVSDDNPYEETLIEYLKTKQGESTTVRDIVLYGPSPLRKLKTNGVRDLLISLERSAIVICKKEGKKEWYTFNSSQV